VTGRQGRRPRKLLDDLKERRGYSYLKEEALDRTRWRARFGRGFGPVVRQTTKLIYIYTYMCVCVCVCIHHAHFCHSEPYVVFFHPLRLTTSLLQLLKGTSSAQKIIY